jgi:riboflavin synthase
VGLITRLDPQGESYWLEVEVPEEIARASVSKGSIAIDGISLTVADLTGRRVGVQIVPFTFQHTTLGAARAGDPVNLEADVIGKYVARMLDARQAPVEPAGRGVR